MSVFYAWLARLALRRAKQLAVLWLVILAAAAFGAAHLEKKLQVGGFSLPGTQFNTASKVLSNELQISSDKSVVVVYTSQHYRVTDKPFASQVEASLGRLARFRYVTKVQSFYHPGLPFLVSKDNHTTYAIVTMKGSENFLEQQTPALRKVAAAPPLTVHLVGQSAVNYDVEKASSKDLEKVERITLPIVLLLLILVFGSVVAAGVPLVMGAVSVAVALALVYLLALTTDVSIFALNIGSMIGLGLSIDFSLIMVSRFREELRKATLEEAMHRTLQTAGRSITFSGITLALTMTVLSLFPVMVIRSVAVAIALVAATAIVTGLFLLPVVLVLLHRHLDRWNLRSKIGFLRGDGQGWHRTIARVMKTPVLSICAALAVIALITAPALWLKIRGVTVDVLPASTESRQAVDLVRHDFGQGELSPIFVVVQAPTDGGIWDPPVLEGIYELHEWMLHDPRVDHVQSLASLVPNPSPGYLESLSPATILTSPDRTRIAKQVATLHGDKRTTVLIVYPKDGPTDKSTQSLMLDLRHYVKNVIPGFKGMNVLVGGEPAEHYDFIRTVYGEFPILLVLSLLVTFVVLMLFFHSLILPLFAIVMNALSLLASFGLLVLVFQWGIGDSIFSFKALGALEAYTPVMLFSVLFGLSTDYQVFLLTRVREQVHLGKTNEEAIAAGLEQTAGLITAAAMIMIVVFGSFAFTGVLVIKEIGFGLAVAVAIDATLVRVVLVPASMKLLGKWNWWMPRVLDGVIPEIDEGGLGDTPVAPSAPSAPAPAPG
ncbi:MAG TPA: MMPL family transporter [Gaiellaceae bacterium]|nr:MMPL family transporter [Gaiellaceae bacterium]